MHYIGRTFNILSTPVVFTNDAATTGGFSMSPYAGAMLMVTEVAGGGSATVTFRTKANSGDASSFVVADASNNPITITVTAGRAYALPDALYACSWVLATSNASVTCNLVLKG